MKSRRRMERIKLPSSDDDAVTKEGAKIASSSIVHDPFVFDGRLGGTDQI
jgi:hypothetical protein